ncbi:hypothetical protein AQJ30_18935 [Streptomyces longwoodensis]|uniref:Uncharacterized protein n=1 Tax=Streptomyces longwoodensis TaxID=68231 RepID=A0A101QVW5_9ACTN|nr:hypothetical protein AQJ30_18935 [Streptomyces longwoodensis]
MAVREADAVGRGARRAHHFDDLRDLVVLTDHPAVLDELVAHRCAHLPALLMCAAPGVPPGAAGNPGYAPRPLSRGPAG